MLKTINQLSWLLKNVQISIKSTLEQNALTHFGNLPNTKWKSMKCSKETLLKSSPVKVFNWNKKAKSYEILNIECTLHHWKIKTITQIKKRKVGSFNCMYSTSV